MILIPKITNTNDAINICGPYDKNLAIINEFFNTTIILRGDSLIVSNDKNSDELNELFEVLLKVSHAGIKLNVRDMTYLVKLSKEGKINDALPLYINRHSIINNHAGKPIYPASLSQLEYIKALNNNDLVFGIGPAGTGKTYIAVLYAISMLRENKVNKIILTRPAVEAGESLGFLPGDLKEKVDPYLTPLYDALNEILGAESVEGLIEKGVIEIAPLAYMRGRTLENAYVILDEAQNTTEKQMKMFLTRLGFSSKMIVTGDITQIDLPKGSNSGLQQATQMLKDIIGIKVVKFENVDVVRHPLVQKILDCYDKIEK